MRGWTHPLPLTTDFSFFGSTENEMLSSCWRVGRCVAPTNEANEKPWKIRKTFHSMNWDSAPMANVVNVLKAVGLTICKHESLYACLWTCKPRNWQKWMRWRMKNLLSRQIYFMTCIEVQEITFCSATFIFMQANPVLWSLLERE